MFTAVNICLFFAQCMCVLFCFWLTLLLLNAGVKSRSWDVFLEHLGLVLVSRKSGKVSVSASSRTENRISRSRTQKSPLQAHIQQQKFTEVTDKQSIPKTACSLRLRHRLVRFMYYQVCAFLLINLTTSPFIWWCEYGRDDRLFFLSKRHKVWLMLWRL